MRLTCPNCKAQYEVEESVLPAGGRDVQCSACGHTWYQYPISVALNMRAAELDDEEEDETEDSDRANQPPAPARQIDRTVLDMLREEAERELRERRAGEEAGGLESQPDLALPVRPARPSESRPGRGEGSRAAASAARTAPEAASGARAPDPASRSRLEMLPDIDELSSTLQPRREPRRVTPAPDTVAADSPGEERRGILRGLSMVVIIVAVLLFLYLLSDLITAQVPALETAMSGYVAMIDTLRLLVAGWINSLLALVSGG